MHVDEKGFLLPQNLKNPDISFPNNLVSEAKVLVLDFTNQKPLSQTLNWGLKKHELCKIPDGSGYGSSHFFFWDDDGSGIRIGIQC